MQRVIRVYEKDSDNFIANEKYTYSLNKAKKYFKGLIRSHKKEVVKKDDRLLNIDNEDYNFFKSKSNRFKVKRLEIEKNDIYESPNEIIEIRLEQIKVE